MTYTLKASPLPTPYRKEGRNLSLGIAVDAVDQFQAETAGTAVQYNGQGVQNYTIKSGTNSFHGSVYEYFPDASLCAPRALQLYTGPQSAA